MATGFFWETGRDANSHPYLKDKKIKSYQISSIGWNRVRKSSIEEKFCPMRFHHQDILDFISTHRTKN
jgi:hypothetical protein